MADRLVESAMQLAIRIAFISRLCFLTTRGDETYATGSAFPARTRKFSCFSDPSPHRTSRNANHAVPVISAAVDAMRDIAEGLIEKSKPRSVGGTRP